MVKVSDFARELSEKYGLSLSDASDFIAMMFDVAKDELNAPDSSVKIKGFGTFKVSTIGARASVDVNTGERIIIDGRNKITFTPEVLLRDRVNRPFVQFETVVLNDGVDFSEIDAECAEQDEPTADETEMTTEVEPTATTQQPTVVVAESDTVIPTIAEPQIVDKATLSVEPTTSTDVETSETQNEKNEVETRQNAVNTEDYRDTARRLMASKSANAATVGEASSQNVETTPPEPTDSLSDTDESDLVVNGCRQRSPRLMYVLSVASFLLLVILGIGMYFLYTRIEEKNSVIDRLENRIYAQTASVATAQKSHVITSTATTANTNVVPKDTLSATAKNEKTANVTAKRDSIATKTPSKVAVTAPSDYNYDVRVRTGAYIIVGVAKTVTVQPGQTLASISRTYLGNGMECYVEVLNNRTTVKPGDKLKIPELKLKPRRN